MIQKESNKKMNKEQKSLHVMLYNQKDKKFANASTAVPSFSSFFIYQKQASCVRRCKSSPPPKVLP